MITIIGWLSKEKWSQLVRDGGSGVNKSEQLVEWTRDGAEEEEKEEEGRC
jgi:hypothetical protein